MRVAVRVEQAYEAVSEEMVVPEASQVHWPQVLASQGQEVQGALDQ